jgi:uncharacterized protein YwqG
VVAKTWDDETLGHFVGGYPHFYNGEFLSTCTNCGERMTHVAQIDSEKEYINWLDAGVAYIFVCP